MSDLGFRFAPLAAFFAAAASPGPATLAVAGSAMAQGRRAAISLGLGLSVSLALWGGLVPAGLGPVLIENAQAHFVLRTAGGAFLLWLAWGSARAALRGGEVEAAAPSAAPGRRMFLTRLALNGLAT